MDEYVIRKGQPLDWFAYEDGTPIECEAGIDLWVTKAVDGRRQVQPFTPTEGGHCLIARKTYGRALVWPADLMLIGEPAFDFAPLTYTPAPFSHTVQAGEKVRISPERLDEWVQETYGRPTPTAQE
jgi:hypothetical protein